MVAPMVGEIESIAVSFEGAVPGDSGHWAVVAHSEDPCDDEAKNCSRIVLSHVVDHSEIVPLVSYMLAIDENATEASGETAISGGESMIPKSATLDEEGNAVNDSAVVEPESIEIPEPSSSVDSSECDISHHAAAMVIMGDKIEHPFAGMARIKGVSRPHDNPKILGIGRVTITLV